MVSFVGVLAIRASLCGVYIMGALTFWKLPYQSLVKLPECDPSGATPWPPSGFLGRTHSHSGTWAPALAVVGAVAALLPLLAVAVAEAVAGAGLAGHDNAAIRPCQQFKNHQQSYMLTRKQHQLSGLPLPLLKQQQKELHCYCYNYCYYYCCCCFYY